MKMTPSEIQEINRQIMAGTYKAVEDEPEVVPEPKPKRRAKRAEPEESVTDE